MTTEGPSADAVGRRSGTDGAHPASGEDRTGPRPAPGPGRAAVAGLLAAAVTLGVARLLAAVLDPPADPLLAVGDAVVDATPPWLKDAAIAVFGTADKLALAVGTLLLLAAAAAGLAVAASRATQPQRVVVPGVLALGAVGALAAATRPDTGPLAVVPSLAGAAAGAWTLLALLRALGRREAGGAGPADRSPPLPSSALDRRSFLGLAGGAAAVAVLTAAAGTVVARASRTVEAARELLRLPAPALPAPPIPPGAQSPVPGVVPVLTPAADFYRIDTALRVPQVDPATWRLRVHGLVDREVVLTLDDVLAGELVESHITLACVSNPVGGDLVGNATWLGLPLGPLLAAAGPAPEADMVLSTSADGFTASTPIEALTDGRDALLAVGMNGEPLPAEHGFPARLVVPGLYGYVSATKWVVDLEVTRFAEREAYWTTRGWAARGPVKTASRIEVPRDGAEVAEGEVAVGGTAWAQHRGITAVELQVDDGPWEAATLSAPISVDTWRQWSWRWRATPGTHVLRVRAADPDGFQTADRAGVVPDGATGHHAVTVTVRPAAS